MLARMFKKETEKRSPEPVQRHVRQPRKVEPALPLNAFASWLVEISKTTGLSKRELILLYGEFCLATDSDALTEGQFFRRIRAAGIVRYRESVGARPWRYEIAMAEVIPLQRQGQGP